MIIHYINLDNATERREALETNFAATRLADSPWKLVRFPAISAQDERVKSIYGSRSNQEKACILSHHTLLLEICESDEYNWIVEDDVYFCPQSFSAVSDFIERFADADWDILFTDVDIRSPVHMLNFFWTLKTVELGCISSMNLQAYEFSSATSYIINPKRRYKISKIIKKLPDSVEFLYDLYLSLLVNKGKLTAFVTLPFVTGLSPNAMTSQIQSDQGKVTDLLYYSFRKLLHVSSDTGEILKIVDGIDKNYFDDRAYCIGKIISGFMTNKLMVK